MSITQILKKERSNPYIDMILSGSCLMTGRYKRQNEIHESLRKNYDSDTLNSYKVSYCAAGGIVASTTALITAGVCAYNTIESLL